MKIQTKARKRSILGDLIATLSSWVGASQSEIQTPNNNIVDASPLSLFDAVTYLASLSGSSWSIAGLQHSRMSPANYLKQISGQLTKPIYADIVASDIALELAKKFARKQPISLIDVFGELLAHKFLYHLGTTDEDIIPLNSYASLADTAQEPFPIHTVVFVDNAAYQWTEFTPYEVGSIYLNAFIPTWAFGRQFNAGISTDTPPPQTLGFGMGIWGSAMSVNAQDLFNLYVKPNLGTVISHYIQAYLMSTLSHASPLLGPIYNSLNPQELQKIVDYRISPARVHNWTKGMKDTPLNTLDTITFVDAGVADNLSLQPALRPERAADIIIVFDASSSMRDIGLINIQKYAAAHKFKFPRIDLSKINQVCSVHQDQSDPSIPTVIYIPYIAIPSFNNGWDPLAAKFTSIFNFEFTQDQVDLITGLAQESMRLSQRTIIQTISDWIDRRS